LCFAAFFILVLLYRNTKWTTPLRLSFLQLSGALSYCLYLVHLSVGDLFELIREHEHFALGPVTIVLLRGAFMVALSFAIASLTRKFLEDPFLALKDRLTSPRCEDATSLDSSSVVETVT
jgi:peptidoglycan/LPS O-acetylase OafA/YrhL